MPDHPSHPIIALWCHPRSMSTATERIMRERGDLACFHEPFMYYYYVHRSVRRMPHFEAEEGRPASFAGIRAMLKDAARSAPVFFKDMSYYVIGDLDAEPEFFTAIVSLFLIRDPRRAIMSYVRLDPEVTLEEVGLEAQWRHFSWLAERTGRRPLVVEAETIAREPRASMRRVWRHAGLAECEHAFTWASESVPEEWRHVAGWHQAAASSAGIRPPAEDEEAETAERFARLARTHPQISRYLAHHLPFYERLRREALAA